MESLIKEYIELVLEARRKKREDEERVDEFCGLAGGSIYGTTGLVGVTGGRNPKKRKKRRKKR